MTKASDNAFPSILITEGTEPSAPAAGKQRLYIDSTTHKLKRTDSSGTDVTIESAGSGDVATDTIWDAAGDLAVGTGANTAAKLSIGAAGGAVSRINGAVAWNSGTSFPTAATGDRYWRTDLGLECYYDGTRWLTTTIYSQTLGDMPDNDTTQHMDTAGVGVNSTLGRAGTWVALGDLWLVDWIQHTRVLTTNDGSNYWTVTLKKFTTGVSGSTIDSFTTAAHTMGNMVTTQRNIGALIGTTNVVVQTEVAKTSSPGNIVADHGQLRFRVVVT